MLNGSEKWRRTITGCVDSPFDPTAMVERDIERKDGGIREPQLNTGGEESNPSRRTERGGGSTQLIPDN